MDQALAYKKLGLFAEGHDIGTLRYIDLPEESTGGIKRQATGVLPDEIQ